MASGDPLYDVIFGAYFSPLGSTHPDARCQRITTAVREWMAGRDASRADESAPHKADTPPDRRNPTCVEQWPDCEDGAYHPQCCRFPKSCSCTVRAPIDSAPFAISDLLPSKPVWPVPAVEALTRDAT